MGTDGKGGEGVPEQGRIQGGPGGPCPPIVSVCNIFCAWVLAFRHTTQLTSKRFVNRIAEGVGITPPLPNPNRGSATLQLQV